MTLLLFLVAALDEPDKAPDDWIEIGGNGGSMPSGGKLNERALAGEQPARPVVFLFAGEGVHSSDTDISDLKGGVSWAEIEDAVQAELGETSLEALLLRGEPPLRAFNLQRLCSACSVSPSVH